MVVVAAFCLKSVMTLVVTVVLGTILGSIIAAIGYVVAFVFSSPEISADIGEVLDFPASGILFFDVLLSCLLIAIGLDVQIDNPQKWVLGILFGSLTTMFLLNKFIPMNVRVIGDDSEITAYGYHWLDSAYEKEDYFRLQPYIVKKTQNDILDHQNFVGSLACKETTGVDCGTYTFPSILLNFTDQNMNRFKKMQGFFHDRPSNVYFDGNVLHIEYKPVPKIKGAEEKQERTMTAGQFEQLPEYEQRKNTLLRVRPLSKEISWGVQILCLPESDHEYSVVIQAKKENIERIANLNPLFPYLKSIHSSQFKQVLLQKENLRGRKTLNHT